MGKVLPGVFQQKAANGELRYVVPSPPMGSLMGKIQAVYDMIQSPGRFLVRDAGTLPNENADSLWMARENARRNRKLGKLRDWKDLWGKESGKICLFICAGPSLTDSLEEIAKLLEDNPEKYFTLGFNRSFKAMDLDYFVAEDRRAQEDWIDRNTGKTKLIAATSAAAHIVEKFEERYFGEMFLAGIDEGMTPLRTAMCITQCDAMHVAYKLGAEEIWLYGSDFAVSGLEDEQRPGTYMLERYYFDLPCTDGLMIRPSALQEMQPVEGINGKLCFINYELYCYACYATAMAWQIEESGGVPVRNKSKSGIFFWGS